MNINTDLQATASRIMRADRSDSDSRTPTTTEVANRALIPAPEYVSVSGTIELLKMMLEISQTDRKAMKETERSTEKAAAAADEAQVNALRDQANSTFHAALVDGFVKMGSGAVSMVASELQIHGGALKDRVKETSENVGKAVSKREQLILANATKLTNWGARLKTVGELSDATAGPLTAKMKHGAALRGIDATVDEKRSAALMRSADSLKSDIDNVRQHDSKLFDLVREIESAMNRCTQIALQSR